MQPVVFSEAETDTLWKIHPGGNAAYKVYWSLCFWSDGCGVVKRVSLLQISERARVDENRTRTALKQLIGIGLIRLDGIESGRKPRRIYVVHALERKWQEAVEQGGL